MLLYLQLLAFLGVSWASTLLVDTQYGRVQGHLVSSIKGKERVEVGAFLGIPYGKSTAGEMRFKVGI